MAKYWLTIPKFFIILRHQSKGQFETILSVNKTMGHECVCKNAWDKLLEGGLLLRVFHRILRLIVCQDPSTSPQN